jgi:hypothetical protein
MLITLVAASGCGDDAVSPAPPKIIGGTRIEVASGTVTPAGGAVSLDLPGNALDSMTISVPAGAYTDARTFRISTAPIERHELGADFNPLTPLITIANGGGYADIPMELTIPCTVPDGHFAMAFVYDRATGSLEGMPLARVTERSITVLTSNFSFSSTATTAKRSLAEGSAVLVGESEIVVSSIPESRLEDPFNSGFVPGVDDWQFTNYGSYAYMGHCAGQSATMMWYHSARKQKRGDQPLFGRFDNDGARTTPDIWADDVDGYRFCALAQVTLPWGTLAQRMLDQVESTFPEKLTYNLFAYSIRLTGQPQFVWIIPQSGSMDSTHAMVVYRVENGKIFIADPNYPGKTDRLTEYSLGRFLPYNSGINAQSAGVKYTRFVYLAQSTIINFDLFRSRWGEVITGTAGAEIFPAYQIHALDGDNRMVPLVDGFETKSGVLELDVRNSDVPLKIANVYDASQKLVPMSGNLVRLRFGEHLLGFHITDMQGRWVGFQWVTVRAKEDATDPELPPPSERGTLCTGHSVIDGVGTLVTESSYSIYPTTLFTYWANVLWGSARISVMNFAGVGTYPLYTSTAPADLGSYIISNNGLSWHGTGTLTITRWDSEKVAGTFEFFSRNAAGELTKHATGQFQCDR